MIIIMPHPSSTPQFLRKKVRREAATLFFPYTKDFIFAPMYNDRPCFFIKLSRLGVKDIFCGFTMCMFKVVRCLTIICFVYISIINSRPSPSITPIEVLNEIEAYTYDLTCRLACLRILLKI